MYKGFKNSWRFVSASLFLAAPSLFATLPAIGPQRASVIRVPAAAALDAFTVHGGHAARECNAAEQKLRKLRLVFSEVQEEHAALADELLQELSKDTDFETRWDNAQRTQKEAAKSVSRLRESVASARAQMTQAREHYDGAQDKLIALHENGGADLAQPLADGPAQEHLDALNAKSDVVSLGDLSTSFDDVHSSVELGPASAWSVSDGASAADAGENTLGALGAPSFGSSRSSKRLRGALKDADALYPALVTQAQQEADLAATQVHVVAEELERLEQDLAAAEAQHAAAAQDVRKVQQDVGRMTQLLEDVDDAFEDALELGEAQAAAREDYLEHKAEASLASAAPSGPFEIHPGGHPAAR